MLIKSACVSAGRSSAHHAKRCLPSAHANVFTVTEGRLIVLAAAALRADGLPTCRRKTVSWATPDNPPFVCSVAGFVAM